MINLATRHVSTPALGLALVLLGGCANIDVHHRDGGSLSSELTLVGPSSQPVVRNSDGTLCYGPQPDASIDASAGGALKWFSFGDNSDELPLGGRNPNVLVTRDILFQSCLAETRLKLDREERIKLFYKTLDVIQGINAKTLDGAGVTSDANSGSQNIPQSAAPNLSGKSSGSGGSAWSGGSSGEPSDSSTGW